MKLNQVREATERDAISNWKMYEKQLEEVQEAI
jgi:hypothetical protein